MTLAKTLMVCGTASHVGKSTIVTGLCRIFAQEGMRVAPFKAQNMALNSYVTKDGGEIGRAQAAQAEAAMIEPTVDMNPILLKPESDSRSQIILLGRPLATREATAYYRDRRMFRDVVAASLQRLREMYDLVIIEGAGSPVELNLQHYDLVNMFVARLADAPVLLVGDIDRGGIFASLLGTLMLLPEPDRQRVKGLIVNKFRGDMQLWASGETMLAERSSVPVLGTVPVIPNIGIAEEDSVALETISTPSRQGDMNDSEETGDFVAIAVIRYPYMSNFDEFDALAAETHVRLQFVSNPSDMPEQPDMVILPGTKNTLHDLDWVWRSGFATKIRMLAQQGCAVIGVCGGYQMLGERVCDPHGVESVTGACEPGLGILPVETLLAQLTDKVVQQTTAHLHSQAQRGIYAQVPSMALQAYQIHVGQTDVVTEPLPQGAAPFNIDSAGDDGWMHHDGWIAGSYLHGLFENDHFRHGVISALLARKGQGQTIHPDDLALFSRQRSYDALAQILRQHLNIPLIKTIIG